MRKTLLIKIILIKKKSITLKMNSISNRFKKRLINRDKVLNIMLILFDLYFNLMRKRYQYFKTRIKRRLNFLINVIFILLYYTISIIIK